MEYSPTIETDEIDAGTIEDYSGTHSACNGFAWAYAAEHEDVVVKVGEVQGSEHCWVYDAARDITVDATAFGQFDGLQDGAWDGDQHPHADAEWEAWTEKEAFAEHYDAPMSPFMV